MGTAEFVFVSPHALLDLAYYPTHVTYFSERTREKGHDCTYATNAKVLIIIRLLTILCRLPGCQNAVVHFFS